jgi:hypothetical protein
MVLTDRSIVRGVMVKLQVVAVVVVAYWGRNH